MIKTAIIFFKLKFYKIDEFIIFLILAKLLFILSLIERFLMKTIATQVLVLSLLLPTMSFAAEAGSQEKKEERAVMELAMRARWHEAIKLTYDRDKRHREEERIIRSMIESTDNVNKKYEKEEETILHMVVKLGNFPLVRLLVVEKNADFNQKNKAGETPLTVADWATIQADSPEAEAEAEEILEFLTGRRGPPSQDPKIDFLIEQYGPEDRRVKDLTTKRSRKEEEEECF